MTACSCGSDFLDSGFPGLVGILKKLELLDGVNGGGLFGLLKRH